MPTLQIHDRVSSTHGAVDIRAVLTMLGERTIHASWQVAGVARYGEAVMIVGDNAAGRLEALAQSQDRVSGARLNELVQRCTQIIWGEFTAFEEMNPTPWVILRAIDSSWFEVETDDQDVLARVREIFMDVRSVG